MDKNCLYDLKLSIKMKAVNLDKNGLDMDKNCLAWIKIVHLDKIYDIFDRL